MIQPIVVRQVGTGYQIVAGERRWRAAQRARLHEIPAIVRELDDTQTLEIAIIENIQRADLNAIEEAEAFQRLIVDFGHSQEALGKLVQKSRSHVANLLRLLDLPAAVRQEVANGALTMGHARALITAPDPEKLAADVIKRGLSVRDTEKLARSVKPAALSARHARLRMARRRRCRHRRAGTSARRHARAQGEDRAWRSGWNGDPVLLDARSTRYDLPAVERRTNLTLGRGGSPLA